VIWIAGLLELNVIVWVNTCPPLEFTACAKTVVIWPGVSEMLVGKISTWVTVAAALSELLLPPPQPDIRATEKRIKA